MRQLPITLAAIFIITLVSCDAVEDFFAPVDPLIDQEVVESQDFNLTTPFYGMQVAIDSRVDANDQHVLDLLDNRAEQFLNCQFGDSQIGFEDFMLDDGTVVPPCPSSWCMSSPTVLNARQWAGTCAGESTSPI
ncbi:MAG: hypothetical protein ACREN0_07390 [Thermodesulfobacteriota bacterium]